MRTPCLIAVLLTSPGLWGCQRYQPRPLDAQTMERALEPPSAAALRVEARTLRHPILPPGEIDLADGLSPDEAALIAVLANPSLRAARDRRALADAQVIQAGILPNPQLVGSLALPIFGSLSGTVDGFSIGPSWDLTGLIGRRARVGAAAEARAAVELDVAWQEWQVAQAARGAVYQLLALNEQVTLAAEVQRRLLENLGLVREAVRRALLTAIELSAAESASHRGNARLLALKKQASQQRLALSRALGLPAGTAVALQRGLELPSHLEPPPRDRLLDGLEERRLDLVALRRGYASQEAAVRAAILAQFPRIAIGFQAARDTTNVGTVGVGITIDLPIFDRNQGAIARERATRRKLRDEYVARVFEARSQIARLLDEIVQLDGQLAEARAALPSLERLVETYRIATNEDEADVLSYYLAWNDLTEQRITVLALEQQLATARVALELATGLYRLGVSR